MDAPDDQPPHQMPGWVKASLVGAAIVAVALVLMLLGSSGHGPGQHLG